MKKKLDISGEPRRMQTIVGIARMFFMAVTAYITFSAMMFYSGSATPGALFEKKGDSPIHTIMLVLLCMLFYAEIGRHREKRYHWLLLSGLSVSLLVMNYWVH